MNETEDYSNWFLYQFEHQIINYWMEYNLKHLLLQLLTEGFYSNFFSFVDCGILGCDAI
jgi:hypothetical protein